MIMDCPHCQAQNQEALFCKNCSRYMPDQTGMLEKVTYNRRFWGSYLLEGLLFVLTLIVGWLIWLFFTAKKSQTPAKSLLNIYTLDADTGEMISAGRVWVRDVAVEVLLIGFINAIIGIAGIVDAAFVLFDKNRRSVHDHVTNTIVVYAPRGLPPGMLPDEGDRLTAGPGAGSIPDQLRELALLRDEGAITEEEYEAKRKALADRL